MRHRTPRVVLMFLCALAADAQRVNIAYFFNGDVHARGYYPKNIAIGGAAARITHLMYGKRQSNPSFHRLTAVM